MDRVKFFSIAIVITTLLLVVIWAFIVEPGRLVVKKVDIALPGWHEEHKGMKIAVLTDFHIGFGAMDKEKLNSIINITNAQNPDLILLLGDYVNVSAKNKWAFKFLPEFKKFRAKYGVYGVLGNHESWGVKHEIRNYLKEAGVNVLENRAVSLLINDKSFWIAGLEDPFTGYPDLNYLMKQINDENPMIFLSHNPRVFEKLSKRVNLALGGHTHGGQIYIPFFVNLINRSPFGRSYLRGHMVRGEQHFYISSGLGTTIVPARFLVSPEIVILTLN